LAIAKFVANNKVHMAIKGFLFTVNYGRKLKIGVNIGRKEKVIEFVKRIK